MEISVGVFLIAGVLALVMLALKVSGLSLAPTQPTYKLYAQFKDLGGLSVRGRVSIAGVTIGRVSNITLDSKSMLALVEMEINKDVDTLSLDSIASIRTEGLLGEKYIDISVGGDPDSLADGDTIFDTQEAMSLEKLVSTFASSQLK